MFQINAITNHKYSDNNAKLLAAAINSKGYSNNLWGGYAQWKSINRRVKKGEKGHKVFIFVDKNMAAEGTEPDKQKVVKTRTVFNIDQTELVNK